MEDTGIQKKRGPMKKSQQIVDYRNNTTSRWFRLLIEKIANRGLTPQDIENRRIAAGFAIQAKAAAREETETPVEETPESTETPKEKRARLKKEKAREAVRAARNVNGKPSRDLSFDEVAPPGSEKRKAIRERLLVLTGVDVGPGYRA